MKNMSEEDDIYRELQLLDEEMYMMKKNHESLEKTQEVIRQQHKNLKKQHEEISEQTNKLWCEVVELRRLVVFLESKYPKILNEFVRSYRND